MWLPGGGFNWLSIADWIILGGELALTGDDFNDWIGPFYRLNKAMGAAPGQARREIAAERDSARAIAKQHELQKVLNSVGLYLPWQVPPER